MHILEVEFRRIQKAFELSLHTIYVSSNNSIRRSMFCNTLNQKGPIKQNSMDPFVSEFE